MSRSVGSFLDLHRGTVLLYRFVTALCCSNLIKITQHSAFLGVSLAVVICFFRHVYIGGLYLKLISLFPV